MTPRCSFPGCYLDRGHAGPCTSATREGKRLTAERLAILARFGSADVVDLVGHIAAIEAELAEIKDGPRGGLKSALASSYRHTDALAKELAVLEAENARLREALAEIVRECGETDPSYDIARKALIPVDDILDAALKETP